MPGKIIDGTIDIIGSLLTHPIDTAGAVATGIVDGVKGAGAGWGASAAAFNDPKNQELLNTIYGDKNASYLVGAIAAMPGVSMVAGGAGVAGTVEKAAGKVADKVGDALSKKTPPAIETPSTTDKTTVATTAAAAEGTAGAIPKPKVFNGVELNPDLPPPAAGYDYSPDLVSGAKTENQLYSHWTGLQAEANLANEVAGQGEAVVKWGDKIGAQGNDIISVNPQTGDVTLWDSKYRSSSTTIEQSPTYVKDTTSAAAIQEAKDAIASSNLPPAVMNTALQKLYKGDYTTNTVGSGGAKNSYQVRYCNGKPC